MKKKTGSDSIRLLPFRATPPASFETLYAQYVRKVYQRCYSLIQDKDQAHDLTQDIFLKVFNNWDQFDGRSSRSTWLYSISFNHCIDQLNRKKRFPVVELTPAIDIAQADPGDIDPGDAKIERLQHVLSSMPQQDVQLLLLRYEDMMSVKEIARQLDLQESAVKMRLKRARDKVAKMLEAPGSPG